MRQRLRTWEHCGDARCMLSWLKERLEFHPVLAAVLEGQVAEAEATLRLRGVPHPDAPAPAADNPFA